MTAPHPPGAMTFPELFGLPLAVDVRTASRAFGICTQTAYRLIQRGAFPCPVVRTGRRYRVPTAGMLSALGIEELPLYAEDLDTWVSAPPLPGLDWKDLS
ncbi:helix-turn-helix domain-containing protein [Kitasatospora sp. NPDC096128]|uniref:helix-turn-helix transcriptional regulator n=1 Tax=Kitasatospora sp. NPDC096128 TaxID=3155547 RepID=UPI0033168B44